MDLHAVFVGQRQAGTVAGFQKRAVLPGQFTPHHRANGVNHILTGQVISGRYFGAPGGLLKALLLHKLGAFPAKLYPGKGMDAVVDAVVAGLVAAGHTAVGGIDNGSAFQGGNISSPEVDSLLNWMQVRQPSISA